MENGSETFLLFRKHSVHDFVQRDSGRALSTIILISGLIWFDLCLFRYSSRHLYLCFFSVHIVLLYFIFTFSREFVVDGNNAHCALLLDATDATEHYQTDLLPFFMMIHNIIIIIVTSFFFWRTISTLRINFSLYFCYTKLISMYRHYICVPSSILRSFFLSGVFVDRSFINVIISIDGNIDSTLKCISWILPYERQKTERSTFTSYFLWSISP